jgi:hypothetical protein
MVCKLCEQTITLVGWYETAVVEAVKPVSIRHLLPAHITCWLNAKAIEQALSKQSRWSNAA